jgi:cob(I)alamin adenosyltransferase
VRRAERAAASLARAGELENSEVLRYLNRLSDYVFMLAREAELGRSTVKERAPRPAIAHDPSNEDSFPV